MSKALIESLVKELNYATKKYDEGHPIMSDKDWDNKYFQLKKLEDETQYILEDSPTQLVYYETVNQLNKIKHNHLMLSLDKTKDLDDVKSFINKKDFLMMAKMDGLTCSLHYQNGKLISAETRGDGVIGEDVLHNARVIPSIPNYINYFEDLVIDGEIICSYKDFEYFENEYKNPRNFAAGSIRLLDNKECEKRKLQFVAWDIISGFDEESTLDKKLIKASQLGFTIIPFLTNSYDVDNLKEIISTLSYPIDGLVFKFNDIAYGKTLGATSHHFNNAIAYKFYDEVYETSVIKIEWGMGRTGVLTPVAVFEPVEIDGSIVERASLHNLSILEEMKLKYQGQKVEVFKANAIIPQIAKVYELESDSMIGMEIPSVCPVCGGATEVRKSDGDIKVLYCTNPQCEGKLINQIDHFCGKKGLDIKGMSAATLEKLLSWGWVNNLSDIMTLEKYQQEWINKPGFGEKSVNNLLDNIQSAKNTTLQKFISSIGIPLIGRTLSKELVKYISSYEDFRDKINSKYDFSIIDGFASEKCAAILNFDYTEADKVYPYLTIQNNEKQASNNLDGLNVVITGKLNLFKNRAELQKTIEDKGGKVIGSVSNKTSYLINNDVNSTSSKNKTARELNIPILSEKEFIEIFLTN